MNLISNQVKGIFAESDQESVSATHIRAGSQLHALLSLQHHLGAGWIKWKTIMKKEASYVSPEVEVYEIITEGVFCISDGLDMDSEGGNM